MTSRFKRLLGGFALAGVLFTGLMVGTAYSQATASTTTGVVHIREIISGSLSFASGTNLKIDSAGVQLSGDGDGALTFLGLGNGSDEDLTMNLDDTANTIVFTSSTGANAINMTGFALTVDSCTGCGTSGAATTNTYITQTAAADLSAEQILASLSTGIMRVATTTGVITSLTDSAGIFANISDETGGTGVLVGGTAPVFTTSIDIEAAGVRLSAADGILTILGLGNGQDENLTFDFDNAAANTVAIASGTSATNITYAGNIKTTEGFFSTGSFSGLYIQTNTTPTLSFGASNDVQLTRDAANVLVQLNGTNAQTFRLYETFTDASNYERYGFIAGTNALNITALTAGTGSDDLSITFTAAGAGIVSSASTFKAAGYQSSDGTAGVTVTTCTSFKDGLCVAGT